MRGNLPEICDTGVIFVSAASGETSGKLAVITTVACDR